MTPKQKREKAWARALSDLRCAVRKLAEEAHMKGSARNATEIIDFGARIEATVNKVRKG